MVKQDCLGGTKEPTESNKYLARNGLYYNGYALSADCAEDAFGECFKKMADELWSDVTNEIWHCGEDDCE